MAETRYRALVGLNYPSGNGADEKRVEPGELADDIPAGDVDWLTTQKCIEPAGEAVASGAAKKKASKKASKRGAE